MRTMIHAFVIVFSMVQGVAFANESTLSFDCDDPLNSAPAAVKQTLTDLYRIEASATDLNGAIEKLRVLVSEAQNCRVAAQSPLAKTERELTQEWMALYTWINRIADFMYLNAKGRDHVDWKREYADFASLYEIEA